MWKLTFGFHYFFGDDNVWNVGGFMPPQNGRNPGKETKLKEKETKNKDWIEDDLKTKLENKNAG